MAKDSRDCRLIDYVETVLAPFDEVSFCPVDSAVLAQLAMVRVERVVSGEDESLGPRDLLLAERFDGMFAGFEPELDKQLLFAAAASPRFRHLRIGDARALFDPGREMQFAAMTFTCPGIFTYVAFRGTDASFTGWNEDFNMGWMWPVPGQAEAVRYLADVAARHAGALIVGGHSKGGNLAVYAAAMAAPAVRDRIVRVYCHDGPGFRPEAFAGGEYARIAGRVHKTVPVESVVGVLLEDGDDFGVVESDGRGAEQHSLFRWHVDPDAGDFVYAKKLADSSAFWRQTMRRWVEESDVAELERIVDALFRALAASGEEDATAIIGGGPRAVSAFVEMARNVAPDDRAVLLKAFGSLGGAAARTLGKAGRGTFAK